MIDIIIIDLPHNVVSAMLMVQACHRFWRKVP
jgi:hypothetical protein